MDSVQHTDKKSSDFLFHHMYPVPECCGIQMRLCGNESLQVLSYQCQKCLRYLNVTAKFEYIEKPLELDSGVAKEIDLTP